MQHAEFSVTDRKAEIIQIWFRPPEKGLEPVYQSFKLEEGALTTVLGGGADSAFHSTMSCQIGWLSPDQTVKVEQDFVAIVFEGLAIANGTPVSEGDLIEEGPALEISSSEPFGLVLIQANSDC